MRAKVGRTRWNPEKVKICENFSRDAATHWETKQFGRELVTHKGGCQIWCPLVSVGVRQWKKAGKAESLGSEVLECWSAGVLECGMWRGGKRWKNMEKSGNLGIGRMECWKKLEEAGRGEKFVKIFQGNAEDWGIFCRRASGLLLLRKSLPRTPFFSRYTRYAATTLQPA